MILCCNSNKFHMEFLMLIFFKYENKIMVFKDKLKFKLQSSIIISKMFSLSLLGSILNDNRCWSI